MNIAIVGYGIEGKASYRYWNTTDNVVTIVDEREMVDDLPDGAKALLGADVFSKLGEFDLIIRSPSVNPKKLPYGEKVWSATNEFFEKCPAPIIGVTGTKGKGTTCSLITSILQAAGKTVHLVGNIGTPALQELEKISENDIVVFELSSFQLWDAKKSPHIAVVLMIEPDHLDVHDNMNDYVQAKANIARFVSWGDAVYFQSGNELSRMVANDIRARSQKPATPFGVKLMGSVYEEGGYIKYGDSVIALSSLLKIPGAHNVQNASAAIAATLNFTEDYKAVEEGLQAFSGLDHRLKYVDEIDGITFYDDSIATTPGSAIAAIMSFEEPKVIILGGKSKGADYRELIQTCRDTNTDIVAIGENRRMIHALSDEFQVYCVEVDGDMKEAVASALAMSIEAGVVILSPAAASFDMFKSYADRGDKFIAAVKALER